MQISFELPNPKRYEARWDYDIDTLKRAGFIYNKESFEAFYFKRLCEGIALLISIPFSGSTPDIDRLSHYVLGRTSDGPVIYQPFVEACIGRANYTVTGAERFVLEIVIKAYNQAMDELVQKGIFSEASPIEPDTFTGRPRRM